MIKISGSLIMFSFAYPQAIYRAKKIKLLVLDVDGVLTTGKLFIAPNGDILKPFNTLDGLGLKLLMQTGIQTAIITARNDAAVAFRAKQLGITHYLCDVHDKKIAYGQVQNIAGVTEEECAMIGDDVIDLPILVRCGLPIAVQNAHDFVKQYAQYITQKQGGMGAVREVCDFILFAQNNLERILNEYTQ